MLSRGSIEKAYLLNYLFTHDVFHTQSLYLCLLNQFLTLFNTSNLCAQIKHYTECFQSWLQPLLFHLIKQSTITEIGFLYILQITQQETKPIFYLVIHIISVGIEERKLKRRPNSSHKILEAKLGQIFHKVQANFDDYIEISMLAILHNLEEYSPFSLILCIWHLKKHHAKTVVDY